MTSCLRLRSSETDFSASDYIFAALLIILSISSFDVYNLPSIIAIVGKIFVAQDRIVFSARVRSIFDASLSYAKFFNKSKDFCSA